MRSTVIMGAIEYRKFDDFYAYVGTGFPPERDEYATYEALLKKAKTLGDQRAIEELSHVGPPPYESGEGYRVQWKWANAFEGANEFLYSTLGCKTSMIRVTARC